jgi:hypothetical protein
LKRATAFDFSTNSAIKYTACYKLAVLVPRYSVFHFCCIVFLSVRLGRQALLQVLVLRWLVRPANVFACEGLDFIPVC